MIVAALNKLLVKKIGGLEWVQKEEPDWPRCKKHPKWARKSKPRVKKDTPDCTCHQVWDAKQAYKPEYVPVLRDEEKFLSNEIVQEVIRQLYKFPDELKDEVVLQRSFLSASKVGQCVYKSCLDKLGCKPEPLSVRSKLTFMFGGLLEAVYRYLLRTGSFEGFRFIETPELQRVVIGGEDQRGYYDGVVEVHWKLLSKAVGGSEKWWSELVKRLGKEHIRILFEMKTKSDWGWKKVKAGKTDPDKGIVNGMDNEFGYLSQMGYYLKQAYADGIIDVPLGVWFIVNKNNGSPLESFVALKQLDKYVAQSDENYATVAGVVRDNKPLPPRPFNLSRNGNIPRFPCGYCEQKWNCWSDEPVDHYEIQDIDADAVHYRPVWKTDPTVWLEVDFDGKGQPIFVAVESGGEGDDDEG
jgi:hypothetical protein